VLVTHEHDDHLSGVVRLARKFALPVWPRPGRCAAWRVIDGLEVHRIEAMRACASGRSKCSPSRSTRCTEPAQYVFSDGAGAWRVDRHRVRDAAHPALSTVAMRWWWKPTTTRTCSPQDYPGTLKQRIAGRFGHLGNTQAPNWSLPGLHAAAAHGAAHLSQNNNIPTARAALAAALGCTPD